MPLKPFSSQQLMTALVLVILIIIIQIEIFGLVLSKLGLSRNGITVLLIATLIGSGINLPLTKLTSNFRLENLPPSSRYLIPLKFKEGYTLIAINVGGALIPVAFSVYLMLHAELGILTTALAISIISTISYIFSRPIENLGIGMPLFIAPISAALISMLLTQDNSPALAYICGTLGVLIGADLLRVKNIRQLGVPVAAIGGAGTFDGIFITGIIAVLLTY